MLEQSVNDGVSLLLRSEGWEIHSVGGQCVSPEVHPGCAELKICVRPLGRDIQLAGGTYFLCLPLKG